jgi:hypothetical protein
VSRWRRSRAGLGSGLLLLACVAGIQPLRTRLLEASSLATLSGDSYTLPSPQATLLLSLGYRSALADFIYAHVLVSYGLHFQEKRRFEHVGQYLETITTLDPTFAQPYLFADTLLTMQPEAPRTEDYYKARELLVRGTEALPYHQELWLVAGQFIAYVAPSRLPEAVREEWKLEGARLLSRACELATKNRNIPYHCISAVGLLNRAGQREALIQMLSRTLAVNDDEEIQQLALASLGTWVGEREREQYERRLGAFTARWQADLPFVSKEQMLVLGPSIDPYRCSGNAPVLFASGPASAVTECVTSWASWAQSVELAAQSGVEQH